MNKIENNIFSLKWQFTWIIINKIKKSRTADCLKFLCKACIQTKIDWELQKNSGERPGIFMMS